VKQPHIMGRHAFHKMLVEALSQSSPQEKAEIKAELLRWVEQRESKEAK
jgi:hypothetical protein